MGETKLSFKRYEKKYLLSRETYERLMAGLAPYIEPTDYHRSYIRSIYYDSDDFRLIRHSLDAPVYKEKLRVRSYSREPGMDAPVFVELKKKYKGIVYKRRLVMSGGEAEAWLSGETSAPEDSQMAREIAWFLHENPLRPKVMIACDRLAWQAKDDPELRITFDESIRWREDRLRMDQGSDGEELLPQGHVLMEIKLPEAAPLWLAHLLSELEVYPTSFSKYGTCYKNYLLWEYLEGESVYV